MWELLQKLENLGWKPYGKSIAELSETEKNVRLLTSLSSGLWQFVYDYELIETFDERRQHLNKEFLKDKVYFDYNYRYRLIESALCDEDKLEEFLLDNIKIDET